MAFSRLNKSKTVSWFIILGNREENRIFSIKKIYFNKKTSKTFDISNIKTKELEIMLLNDTYIGLD